jgi:hypothetical protein
MNELKKQQVMEFLAKVFSAMVGTKADHLAAEAVFKYINENLQDEQTEVEQKE